LYIIVLKHHVNGELSDSEKSVDEKSRILSVVIPGTWMAKNILKIFDNNSGV